jgi:two-component system phosphate regulon sensor histidine kinase PhoR
MAYLCEIAIVLLALLCVALWSLWRRALQSTGSRDQLWRNALTALAARDYESAGAFAAMIEDEKGIEVARGDGRALFVTLRRVMRTIESLEIAEREQQRARRDFEDVLASLQDGVLVVDGEARLRYLNSAALTFFGVRVEDVLGAQILEALPSFGLEAAVQQALREGKPNAREVQLFSPRHREIFLRVAPVRQSDGTVTGVVAILQDLTEMRRLERVRRDFVANASHELRTPIATIRATAETVLDSPDDPDLIKRFVPHLVSEAERLSRLVSDLLDLARAESRAESPEAITKTPVNLSDMAREVIGHLQDKATKNEVTLHCDLQDEVHIEGDAAALEQVVFNLVDNALIYTPQGGSVTLKVSYPDKPAIINSTADEAAYVNGGATEALQKSLFPEEIATNDPAKTDGALAHAHLQNGHAINENGIKKTTPQTSARFAMLAVQDTGIGIPTDDLNRIFERFYRVDKARSRAQGGTGLGLAIVKHIVENHDGYVEVESEVGQGTTFRVMLPTV